MLLMTFRVLIMLNNCVMSSFVAQVASACLHNRASRFWSHSVSITVEVVNFQVYKYSVLYSTKPLSLSLP
jgi:hypothetical protein